MKDRRALLGVGAAHGEMGHMDMAMGQVRSTSETKGAVPDVAVLTHDGRAVHLYSDLIADRVVTINFMSIARESELPISTRLAEVASLLGARLGREIHMISITTDPANDTIDRLAAFHRQMGGHAGWTFVQPRVEGAQLVAQRFYRHGRDLSAGGKTDVVQYGNAKVGLWGAFPWDIRAHDAADRLSWITPRPVASGEARRAGPRRLNESGPSWNNRKA